MTTKWAEVPLWSHLKSFASKPIVQTNDNSEIVAELFHLQLQTQEP